MKSIITNIKSIFTWNIDKNMFEEICNKNILIDDGIIKALCEDVPEVDEEIDADNLCITPGFIDSHTHPVFVNNRANEFNMRISGKSYTEIANTGGGIISSINSVRNASFDELYEKTLENIELIFSHGSTTIEAKSGYGLTLKDELKSLKVLKKINEDCVVDIIPTFMAAHAFPPEFKYDKDGYIDLICNEMIPKVAEEKLALYCDVFCEKNYFSVEQSKRILDTGNKYGLKSRLHADEFIDSGAAELAAEINAVSADHLMAVSDKGIQKMADSGVIGTILPGTTLFLGQSEYANGRKMIDNGLEVAIASDFNPGSSTLNNLSIAMFLATLYCGLTIKEAFKAVTYNSAKAVNLENRLGLVKENYQADLLFWNIESINEIPYWLGSDRMINIMKNGEFLEY
ncbi:MAG: imidazolonepropionase [Candidatus Marinimicrobia bacterium]|nr:imidazolonepropionase [Candidatus Neomarinimicrobiota bacterium]|tara:strand:+ start:6318 stop:7520 length:1203 start_codon:yes stop_codon:yes gene_type:complete